MDDARPAASAVETILRTLRRGQRQLTRQPRETVQGAVQTAVRAAVKQLLALGHASAPAEGGASSVTYRVDDLARASGVTVRNIRAYQERGLLHPPRRAGRTALFDESHLARLKIIASMLERGYTAANIREMLGAWESGLDLAQVLGLEGALMPPADDPVVLPVAEARELSGGDDSYRLLLEAGLVERAGARARVLRPRLLAAFAEMRGYGLSTESLVDVHARVVPSAEEIARILVAAGAAELAPRYLEGAGATPDDVSELVALLTRFRAVALGAVTETVAAAVETQIEDLLAAYLAAAVLEGDETG